MQVQARHSKAETHRRECPTNRNQTLNGTRKVGLNSCGEHCLKIKPVTEENSTNLKCSSQGQKKSHKHQERANGCQAAQDQDKEKQREFKECVTGGSGIKTKSN